MFCSNLVEVGLMERLHVEVIDQVRHFCRLVQWISTSLQVLLLARLLLSSLAD